MGNGIFPNDLKWCNAFLNLNTYKWKQGGFYFFYVFHGMLFQSLFDLVQSTSLKYFALDPLDLVEPLVANYHHAVLPQHNVPSFLTFWQNVLLDLVGHELCGAEGIA